MADAPGPEPYCLSVSLRVAPATCRACQDQYLELPEEFRVMIFAPEPGTAQPVSEQRRLRKWQEPENSCRPTE